MKTFKGILMICLTIITMQSKAQMLSEIKTLPQADSLWKHVGQRIEIASYIFNTEYFPDYDVTLLSVGDRSPNQVLTLIIRGDDRNNFKSPPEIYYRNRDVKISGVLQSNNGKLEIPIKSPSQIAIVVKTIVSR